MRRHIVEFVRPDLSCFGHMTYTADELALSQVNEERMREIIQVAIKDATTRKLVAPSATRFFTGIVLKVSKSVSDLAQFSTITPRVVPMITQPAFAMDIVWEDPALPSGLYWRSPPDTKGNRVLSWTMQFKNETRGVTEVAESSVEEWLQPGFSANFVPEQQAASYMMELVLKVLALAAMGPPEERLTVLDEQGVQQHGLADHSGLRTGSGKAIWFHDMGSIDTPENRHDATLVGRIDCERCDHPIHGAGVTWIYTLPAHRMDGLDLERRITTARI